VDFRLECDHLDMLAKNLINIHGLRLEVENLKWYSYH
jgi:hypothetical protein